MKRLFIAASVAAAVIATQSVYAGEDGHERRRTSTSSSPSVTTSATTSAATPHPGRLLASNCFQCHGTEGRSLGGIDSIAGKSASDIYGDVKEMQRKPVGDNIMFAHSHGYTDQELRLIADYFASLPR